MSDVRITGRIVLAVALVVAAAACGGSSAKVGGGATSSTSSTSTPAVSSTTGSSTSTSSTAAPPTPGSTEPTTASTGPPASVPPPDDGWAVQTFEADADSAGKWSGTAQVRNANAQARSGDFVFTLLRGGSVIAMLNGSLGNVAAGGTGTATLTSEQNYTPGGYTYTFKATFGF